MKRYIGYYDNFHLHQYWVKSVRFWSYSGPHFPAFELSISPYSLRENSD